MTTGERFFYGGMTAGDRMRTMRKEMDLIWLEINRHKHVVVELTYILDYVRLTREQVIEIMQELEWRRVTISQLQEMKRKRKDAISHLRARHIEVQKRTRLAQHDVGTEQAQ